MGKHAKATAKLKKRVNATINVLNSKDKLKE